jgi:hypothetical protein
LLSPFLLVLRKHPEIASLRVKYEDSRLDELNQPGSSCFSRWLLLGAGLGCLVALYRVRVR